MISTKNNNNDGIARSLRSIGFVNDIRGKYDKAIEYYLKSLTINEKVGQKKEILTVITFIADTYYKKHDLIDGGDYESILCNNIMDFKYQWRNINICLVCKS